jgi:hypothetical protein
MTLSFFHAYYIFFQSHEYNFTVPTLCGKEGIYEFIYKKFFPALRLLPLPQVKKFHPVPSDWCSTEALNKC